MCQIDVVGGANCVQPSEGRRVPHTETALPRRDIDALVGDLVI
jgi:hypothetical protein